MEEKVGWEDFRLIRKSFDLFLIGVMAGRGGFKPAVKWSFDYFPPSVFQIPKTFMPSAEVEEHCQRVNLALI
jgi:hypothetical protein